MKLDWDNDELDESDNLIQDSVYVGTPTQIPGIELESEIEIPGSAIAMAPINSDAEMAAAAANAGFVNVPTATAVPAMDVIVIDDDVPDGNSVTLHECKVEPNDMSEIK